MNQESPPALLRRGITFDGYDDQFNLTMTYRLGDTKPLL